MPGKITNSAPMNLNIKVVKILSLGVACYKLSKTYRDIVISSGHHRLFFLCSKISMPFMLPLNNWLKFRHFV